MSNDERDESLVSTWGDELSASAIQVILLNSLIWSISALLGQSLILLVTGPLASLIFLIAKIKHWIRKKTRLAEEHKNRAITLFAESVANPEMADDLIRGHGLKLGDPGADEYLKHISSRDLEFLRQIGSINAEWRWWVGAALARSIVWSGANQDNFIAFVSSMAWRQVLSMLSHVKPSEDRWRGFSSQSPYVVRFWALTKKVRKQLCIENPGDSAAILGSEPRRLYSDDFLLEIVRAEHQCATSLAAWDEEIALRMAEIAPEHAKEIAKVVPNKAVQIAARVPGAFK